MEELIRTLLLADSGVSSIAGARVNFGAHPQGQPFPAVVLNTISDFGGYNVASPDGLFSARIQADCYADGYGPAKLLSRAVVAALSGYSGNGIQGVFHVSTRDSREGGTNEATRPYRVSLDFTLTYST